MEKKPFIGQMDRKIQVVELSKEKTTTGSEIDTDTTICEPFAFMEEVSGGEVEEGKVIQLVNRKYTVRYRPELVLKQNKLLVVDGAYRFEVNNIIEIGRKSHLTLVCRKYE